MHLLTTNLLAWLFIAAAFVATGYALTTGTTKKIFMKLGIVAALATIVAGVVCVYFVQTDEKRIRRTIEEMRVAIIAGDINKVLSFVEEDALKVRVAANVYVDPGKAQIKNIKVSDFKVNELNRMSSPPRARVSFRASASGVATGEWGGPFTTLVDFDLVELRLESDGVWRVTDNVNFGFPRGF